MLARSPRPLGRPLGRHRHPRRSPAGRCDGRVAPGAVVLDLPPASAGIPPFRQTGPRRAPPSSGVAGLGDRCTAKVARRTPRPGQRHPAEPLGRVGRLREAGPPLFAGRPRHPEHRPDHSRAAPTGSPQERGRAASPATYGATVFLADPWGSPGLSPQEPGAGLRSWAVPRPVRRL
jgi:hypothetical protein